MRLLGTEYGKRRDKEKLSVRHGQTDPAYREMDEEAYDMAVVYANSEELIAVKKFHEKDGKVNMCKAIREMLEDERQEGIQAGIREGIREGEILKCTLKCTL